jgi:hypothetical protein
MRRALLTTSVFAVLLFVLFLLFSGASILTDLMKTLVVSAAFGLYQVWSLRRREDSTAAGK